MRKMFHVTYDTVTPESSEHGNFADGGFLTPGGWRNTCEGLFGEAAGKLKAECALTLREAVDLVAVGMLEDTGNGDSFAEIDGRTNYRSAEVERRTLHAPDGITAASAARLRRLLKMG